MRKKATLPAPFAVFFISFLLFFELPLTPVFAKTDSSAAFQLQAGDRLEITVYREDDLSKVYEIDPAGSLNFPLIGTIQVAGLRIDELLDRLNWNLRKYLINPQISISRAETTIKSISVLGQVKRPGAFDYTPGLTLMRLISQAGGFERAANKRKIRVVRMVNGKKQSTLVNGASIINGEETDPRVDPGDMVVVSEAIF